MKTPKLHFYFFALAARGEGLSGSDRIFIEFAKRWSKQFKVEIFLWEEGLRMCQRQGLDKSKVKFNVLPLSKWQKINFVISYFLIIIKSIWVALKLKIQDEAEVIVYSASDFWMDSLPGWILKCRYPKIRWIGSWYLTAPNPFRGFIENNSSIEVPKLNTLFYWLSQKLILYLLKVKVDFVFVTSEPDKLKFPNHIKNKSVLVIKGGVDLKVNRLWQKKFKNLSKVYDAVFQGRFHLQKGVLELIDIWNLVIQKKKSAKLIMIGDGPLMTKVRAKIKKLHLEDNIILAGYKYDGEDKFRIFYQTKIVVHPVIYDSGGMSAAEAMSLGLPGVSFDLESLKTYYPQGMLKASIGNKEDFARLIIKLLESPKFYRKKAIEAKALIYKDWSWDQRADEVLEEIKLNSNYKL